jgi:hypothetical protein
MKKQGIRLIAAAAALFALALVIQVSWASAAPKLAFTVGSSGSGHGEFEGPERMASDRNGHVWVVDTGNFYLIRLQEFDLAGKFLSEFQLENSQFSKEPRPRVAIDSQGHIWLTNYGHVWEYTQAGEYIGQVGEPGSGVGQFTGTEGLAIDSEDNIWVQGSGAAHARILGFTPTGTLIKEFEVPSYNPIGIDSANHIWLGSNPIKEYNRGGEYLGQIGQGYLKSPRSPPVIDRADNIWIYDLFYGIKEFKPDGTYMGLIGENPLGGSEFYGAWGPTFDAHGDLWVENPGEDEIQKWAVNWEVEGTSEPEGVKNSSLRAVSCASEGTCVSVGEYAASSGGSRTMAKVKMPGLPWQIFPPVNPGTTGNYLTGVSCAPSSACTAIGSYASPGVSSALAERWNGSTWAVQSMPTPPAGTTYTLNGVSCPTSNSCFAVGYSSTESGAKQAPLVESWNGTSWTVSSVPSPEGYARSGLEGVSCTSASDCWAVGYGYAQKGLPTLALAERLIGSKWSINSPKGFSKELTDVTCGAYISCVALANESLTILRWNGGTWVQGSAPTPEGALSSVLSAATCISASACAIVGRYTDKEGIVRPLGIRWNGLEWWLHNPPSAFAAEGSYLQGAACRSPVVCFGVGSSYNPLRTLTESLVGDAK